MWDRSRPIAIEVFRCDEANRFGTKKNFFTRWCMMTKFLWLGEWFHTHLDLYVFPPLVAMALLLLLTILIRYFFASTIAYVVTLVPVIFTLGQVFGLPAIPLLLLVAASAQLASLMTHYGNAVGPLLFGAGYVPESRWWFTGHVIAFYSMAVYFVVGLAWWTVLGLW
uniref:anion permease n=1 Tax=Veillonella magna TaxID=464322 RepID=UPI00402AFE7C